MRSLIAVVTILALATGPAVAQQTRSAVGKTTKTTTRHWDGSKEVVYPNGRREFYNADGSPRGINRTCSTSRGYLGLPGECTSWGPNSYGGR